MTTNQIIWTTAITFSAVILQFILDLSKASIMKNKVTILNVLLGILRYGSAMYLVLNFLFKDGEKYDVKNSVFFLSLGILAISINAASDIFQIYNKRLIFIVEKSMGVIEKSIFLNKNNDSNLRDHINDLETKVSELESQISKLKSSDINSKQ